MVDSSKVSIYSPEDEKERTNMAYVYAVSLVAAVGGLLFGFDTGVISGAIPFVTKHFVLDPHQEGFAVSNLMIACTVGAAFAGAIADRFGRKRVLMLAAILFAVSAIMAGIPKTFGELIVARFIGGIAVGIASVVSPMYIAEISPANIRGRLVAINQLAIVLGVLSSYFSNWLLVDIGPDNWRWMFAVQAFPSVVFFAFLFFIPESPRWLVQRGRRNTALSIFTKIGGGNYAETELHEIESTGEKEQGKISELFRPGMRKVLLIGLLLALFAHITGIDIIAYYGPTIFIKAGFESASSAILASVVLGITGFIFTCIGLMTVDRFGRKPLLLIGLTGMGISLAFTAVAFKTPVSGAAWILIPVITYMASFAMSVGVVIWVYTSEIFPNKIRGRAMSIATMVLWLSNVIVTQTFPWMMDRIGGNSFYIYSGICAIAILFVWSMLVETKRKSLEDIERMWTE